MSGQEKSFYGYMDGYQESRLRLGNIVWDYKNPDSMRSCIRQASDSSFENDEWSYTDPRSKCRVKISEHGEFGMVAAGEPFLSIIFGRSAKYHAEIEANEMNRIEILSEKLNEMVKEVIKSEPGRKWLHTHLTAAFTLFKRGKRFFRRPRIWLLVGKYVADDAKYITVRNHEGTAQVRGGGPADPSLVTSVQGGLGGAQGEDAEVQWTMKGKRVWACKWLLLKCTIRNVPKKQAAAEKGDFDVEVTNRFAQGSVRSGDVLFARLEVASSKTVDKVEQDNVVEEKVVKKKLDEGKLYKAQLDDDKVDKEKEAKEEEAKDKVAEDKAAEEKLVDDMSEEDWIAFDKYVKKAEIEYP